MFPLTAYVRKNLMLYTASVIRPSEWWPHLRDLPLENPNPRSKEPIHLLIEADLYGLLLLSDCHQQSSVGHTHGPKNRTWLHHIWFSIYRFVHCGWSSCVTLRLRMQRRFVATEILGEWEDFRRNYKTYCTLRWLCERLETATLISGLG